MPGLPCRLGSFLPSHVHTPRLALGEHSWLAGESCSHLGSLSKYGMGDRQECMGFTRDPVSVALLIPLVGESP